MKDFKAFEIIENIWQSIVLYMPSILGAILFFIIGWLLAKLISIGLKKILVKLRIDKIGDKLNEIEFISKSNLDIKFSEVISKIIYLVLMLIVLMISTEILNIEVLTNLLNDIFNYLPSILVACVMLVFGLIIAEYIRKIIATSADSLGIPSAKLIASFVFYFLIINVLISALTQAGIETEFISQNLTLIIGGFILAFAIGYGFASKNTVANYLSSFYTKSQIKVGDKIRIHDRVGKVIDMNKSSLILYTEEQTELIIPLNQTSTSLIEVLESDK